MPTSPREEEDLELPPLDGEGEEEEQGAAEDDELGTADDPNALDDATGDDDPVELEVEGSEGGWLEGTEEAGVDVASFDVAIGGEDAVLEDAEAEGDGVDDDFTGIEDTSTSDDGGEEGPLVDDDAIREEDLPQLDADDEGDTPDDDLYDRSMLAAEEELRWDDRAWARAPAQDVSFDQDDSGILAVPGDDGPRDTRWRQLDELGNVSAVAFVPGGSVMLAVEKSDRTLLVRILPEGEARIVAEVEGGEESRVTQLKWDVANGWIVAFGPFGVQAFRPA